MKGSVDERPLLSLAERAVNGLSKRTEDSDDATHDKVRGQPLVVTERFIFRCVCLVMAVYFSYCAYVQLNDPDYAAWIAIYGAAALHGYIEAFSVAPEEAHMPVWLPLAMAAGGFASSLWDELSAQSSSHVITLLPQLVKNSLDVRAETGRERLGLLITLGWFLFVRFFYYERFRADPIRRVTRSMSIPALIPLIMALCLVAFAIIRPISVAVDSPAHCSGLGFSPSLRSSMADVSDKQQSPRRPPVDNLATGACQLPDSHSCPSGGHRNALDANAPTHNLADDMRAGNDFIGRSPAQRVIRLAVQPRYEEL